MEEKRDIKETEKICEIINGEFSWVLKVDGQNINFQNAGNAEYFEQHYKELGYTVIWKESITRY